MELLPSSALSLSERLESGDITAEALMDATLARIKAINPKVNAIVSLGDTEALMAEARAADTAPRKGWLHGIPIAVKDLSDAVGYPTSRGSPLFAGEMAQKDCLHVKRMRDAGAIVIGKTNTPEFGLGSHTFNAVFGSTLNPYDTTRTCGGSSGGASVALATGMLSIADGSDMMGSLRNPAAWGNVYGMRPSVGVVPSEPKSDTYLHQLSTNGPMARSPRDLAALLDTMAGPDPRQPFALPLPMTLPDIDADVTGRRIGWLGDWGRAYPFEDGIIDLCETALAQFSDMGLVVEDLAPPISRDVIWTAWQGLRHYAVGCGLVPLFKDKTTRQRLKKTAQWEIESCLKQSGQDIYEFSALRSTWFAKAASLFETFDVLVLPTTQVWPFEMSTEYPTEIAGQGLDTYHRWMEVTIPASLIGLPVVNIPIGFGANGLPMGIQLIGPRGGDGPLLQIAEAWHKATDWPNARPPKL